MLTLKPMLVSGRSVSIKTWEVVEAGGAVQVYKPSMLTNSHRLLHLGQLCLIHGCSFQKCALKTRSRDCLVDDFYMAKKWLRVLVNVVAI